MLRRSHPNSIRMRTSGSTCATTGSPISSSKPTRISSTCAVRHGTRSSTDRGKSHPLNGEYGPIGSDQCRLVLELHTLGEDAYFGTADPTTISLNAEGVAVGFTDADVIEASKALSGWTVGSGARIGDGAGRFPMAMRYRGTAAVAARRAPTQAGHLCGCASLVEEHQPCRIEIRLEGEPSIALLFAGVGSLFFKRHLVAAVESVECADCKALAPLGD